MKVITILSSFVSSSLFFHSATANSGSVIENEGQPKLRVSKMMGAVSSNLVINTKKKKQKNASATNSMTSRERITNYVNEGQMFFIMNGVPALYEDPSSDPMFVTYLQWFCAPTHAPPDANGDGMYDSLVSRVVSYVPGSTSTLQNEKGAGATQGKFSTHGYTASWSKVADYYDEYMVDFDDTTVWHWKGNSFNGYETSPPGGKGGCVFAGEGLWTFDTDHPIIQEMANELGVELTAKSCKDTYAETWYTNNNNGSILPKLD